MWIEYRSTRGGVPATRRALRGVVAVVMCVSGFAGCDRAGEPDQPNAYLASPRSKNHRFTSRLAASVQTRQQDNGKFQPLGLVNRH